MDPQDDPEARIRALEKPLSDAAETSELGAPVPTKPYPQQSAYFPPPPTAGPSGPTQSTFPYPPQPQRTEGVAAWVVLTVVVLVLLVGGAGAAIYFSNTMSDGSAGRDSTTTEPGGFDGGGGALDRQPSSAIPAPVPPPGKQQVMENPPPGAQLSISGVEGNRTFACSDNTVNISGVSNTVTITGHCDRIIVSGVKNVVHVDAVETIAVSGFDNQVFYRDGSPQITNPGDDSNRVAQG
jgi:hypothetical protein